MRVAGLVFLLAVPAFAQDLDALKEQLQDDVALKRFEAARASWLTISSRISRDFVSDSSQIRRRALTAVISSIFSTMHPT